MKKILATLMIVMLTTAVFGFNHRVYAQGKTYYIDSANGNDNNSGTSESSPWLTFNNVNNRRLFAGDRVLLKRGGYWRQSLIINGQGTENNPIEVGAYGSGPRPVIDGQGMNDFKCLYWNNAAGGKISSITVMNAGMGVFLFGNGTGPLTVEDVVSINIKGRYNDGDPQLAFSYGIAVYGTWGHQMTIKNCDVSGGGGGIIAWGSTVPVIIENCYIHDAYVPSDPNKEDSTALDGLHLMHAPFRIKNCVLDNCTYKAPLGTTGILFAYYSGAIKSEMTNCIIENIKDYGSTDQCAIDFEDDFNNIEIRNCTFINNAGAAIEFLDDTKYSHDISVINCNFYKNGASKYHTFKSEISVIETGVIDFSKQPWVKKGDPAGIRHTAKFIDNVWVPYAQDYVFLQGDTKDTCFPIIDRESDLSGMEIINLQNRGVDGTISYNSHPVVSTGPDLYGQKVNTPFTLSGSATDDGGAPTITWEQIAGPAIAKFSNINVAKPTVTLPKEGDYIFRLVASDGTYTVSKLVNVTTSQKTKPPVSSRPTASSSNSSKPSTNSSDASSSPAPSPSSSAAIPSQDETSAVMSSRLQEAVSSAAIGLGAGKSSSIIIIATLACIALALILGIFIKRYIGQRRLKADNITNEK